MPLRPLTARQVVRKLQRAGFQKIRQRGGHARYANSQGRGVTVPIHPGDIPVHVLRFILQQAGLSEADWEQF